MPGRTAEAELAGSTKNGRSLDARMKVDVLVLSAGSGGIWTKWSSSEAEVPMYRLLSTSGGGLLAEK